MAAALIFFDASNEQVKELILQLVEAGHTVQVHPIEELQFPALAHVVGEARPDSSKQEAGQ